MTDLQLKLALRPGTEILTNDEGVSVRVGRRGVRFPASDGVGRVISELESGIGETELKAGALEAGGMKALFLTDQVLGRLKTLGVVTWTVEGDGAPLAELVPMSGRCPAPHEHGPEGSVRLSRFAIVRNDGGSLIVEGVRGHGTVRLIDPGMVGLLASLAEGGEPEELSERAGLDQDTVGRVLALLQAAGALTGVDESGASEEDSSSQLRHWEPHDLYFHSRSRLGRHTGGFGGTYRFEGELDPLPLFRSAASEQVISLEKPDLAAIEEADPSFTTVLESRASIRSHAESPMSVEQLGEFLYRSLRIKAHFSDERGELSQRVYPAGGALYEIDVYPVVDRCEGLDSGLYRYDPMAHTLEYVAGRTPAVDELLTAAFYTADQKSRPQVMLALVARFNRMQWKYEGMAYAAILKHVGVIFQTMYLVATAMKLAPCALGGGDSDLFAQAAGLDYWAETSVGEFIIGRPEGEG